MSLKNIVAKTGGDLWGAGAQANIPAPGHSSVDRSVSLLVGRDGRVIINSFGGASWQEVIDDLKDRGLVDEQRRPLGFGGQSRESYARLPIDDAERRRTALKLWELGREVSSHSLTARHVRSRHVRRLLPGPDVLRHAAEMPIRVYDREATRTQPAMLVAVSDATGVMTAVEITYLDPNARRSGRLRLSRKTVGKVPPSSAVRLDPVGTEMLAGEGVFTTLSASERFHLPGWALLSTRNLRTFAPPVGLRSLLIAADRGRDGEASANLLAGRARRAGLKVRIEYPPGLAQDWNEAAGSRVMQPWMSTEPASL